MSKYHKVITAMGEEGWESLPPDVARALKLYFEQHIHLPPGVVRQMLDLKGDPMLRTPPGTAYRLLADVGRDGLGRLIGRDPGDDGAADIVYSERSERSQSASSWTMDPSALARISWDITGGEATGRDDAYYAVLAADTGENADSFMLNPGAFGGVGYDYQQEVLSSGPVKARIAWLKTEAFDPESWHWDSEEERRAWEELDVLPEGAEEDSPDLPEIVSDLLQELGGGKSDDAQWRWLTR